MIAISICSYIESKLLMKRQIYVDLVNKAREFDKILVNNVDENHKLIQQIYSKLI